MKIATKKCFTECSIQLEKDHMHDPQPAEEGIITQSFPFADDDILTNISDSES